MKGAIIGDIIGSVYEFHNIKTKAFPLWSPAGRFTDDTVMTVACAVALYNNTHEFDELLEDLTEVYHDYGNRYRHRGYGSRFKRWLRSSNPQPYNSWGNGAPMRCSSAGWLAETPERAWILGTYTAAPTHNHPEAMKAAGLTATLIWHARHGMDRDDLKGIASRYYEIPRLDDIRDDYTFDVSCMGTMPVALSAFFESIDFEDAIRNAVSIGGDSDTIAAITGSIAEAFYGIPEDLWEKACVYLEDGLIRDVEAFYWYIQDRDENDDSV